MEFRSLKSQYQAIKNEIDAAMSQVIAETNFISGHQVTELEKELADYVGVKHCVTCANGTDALSLALMVWQIGPGDAVFVPDFTFFSSGEVVSFEGASPIFVDVDSETYNIHSGKLEEAILRVLEEGRYTPKVIVAVDLFGQPADYVELRKIADKYDLMILEDSAQGFGGSIGEKKTCSFGDISTTSFFPMKPLGCYGDGGAVFTDNDEWADLLRSYKNHGKGSFKYDNVRIGMNSRLDTIQAAVLRAKLPHFSLYEIENINKVAVLYTQQLKDAVKVPVIKEGFLSSWAQYTIQLPNEETRNGLQAYLKSKDIPTMIYYPKAMHDQLAFDTFEGDEEWLAITSRLCRTVLSLPIHPYMKEEETLRVTKEIKNYLE
mgnify:CR=1 FL=1